MSPLTSFLSARRQGRTPALASPPARHSGVPLCSPNFPLAAALGEDETSEFKGRGNSRLGVSGRNRPLGIPVVAVGGRMLEGTVSEGCLWGDVAPLLPASTDSGAPVSALRCCVWLFGEGHGRRSCCPQDMLNHSPLARDAGCSLVLSWHVPEGPHLVYFTWTTSSFLKHIERCARRIKTGEICW